MDTLDHHSDTTNKHQPHEVQTQPKFQSKLAFSSLPAATNIYIHQQTTQYLYTLTTIFPTSQKQ